MPAAQTELIEGIQAQGTQPELRQGFEGNLEAVEPGSGWFRHLLNHSIDSIAEI
jgi:hypothetical protein